MPRAYVGTGGFATKSFSVANRPEESLLLLLLKAAQRAGNCYYFIAGRSEESLLLLLLKAAQRAGYSSAWREIIATEISIEVQKSVVYFWPNVL